MELIGKKVRSAAFGEGEIIAREEDKLSVRFASVEKKFMYPSCFDGFLTIEDAALGAEMRAELNAIRHQKALAEQKVRQIEALRVVQEREEQTRRAAVRAGQAAGALATQAVRTENVPLPFFVFQGTTYDRESKGEYIWAPLSDPAGRKHQYWDMLMQVRQGDILFHGCGSKIMAISVALGRCYEANQPKDPLDEKTGGQAGRRVDCSYVLLQKPLELISCRAEIQRWRFSKYNAFKTDGTSNQGYLYELPRELAAVFLNRIVENAPSVGALEFVKVFLAGQA